MPPPLIIYWSRRDFRLADNPALTKAIEESRGTGTPLLPLFILEDYMVAAEPSEQFGYPSRWFLSRAVPPFLTQFPVHAIVRGKAAQYFRRLALSYTLTVFVNDDVYPDFATQVSKMEEHGIRVVVCSDTLTVPRTTRTGSGGVYSVFTPFKNAVWGSFVHAPVLPKPDLASCTYLSPSQCKELVDQVHCDEETLFRTVSHARTVSVGNHVIDLDVLTPPPLLHDWYVSEAEACAHFDRFLSCELLAHYDTGRDSLGGDTERVDVSPHTYEGKTSRMSLALAWGLVSSRMLMKRIQEYFCEEFDNPRSGRVNQGALTYVSELIWREFYRYLFIHNPGLMQVEFQARFRGTIAWVPDDVAYERFLAWIRGETGYPLVDAAMGQIASRGWMHNRARMVVASVLTKNFGVDWRWGQEYFRAALIDLDEASNNGGWQWGASVGADPKPIRIFNPTLQAKKYDPDGAYQARYLRESGSFMQSERLPIIEHTDAREEALVRYGLTQTTPRDY